MWYIKQNWACAIRKQSELFGKVRYPYSTHYFNARVLALMFFNMLYIGWLRYLC